MTGKLKGEVMDVWSKIDDFPRYLINPMGEVVDEDGRLLRPHKVTGGALSVSLKGEDGEYYMRSLKVLVAEKFVDFDFDIEHRDVESFDTPILLDNNPENVVAANIVWRPRWFAWRYVHQFKDIDPKYYRGPMRCFQNNIQFRDVISVCMRYGLLFEKVYNAARSFETGVYYEYMGSWDGKGDMPPPVWPQGNCFAFID